MRTGRLLLFVVIIAAVVWTQVKSKWDQDAQDAIVKASGFASYEDLQRASGLGIKDPALWVEEKKRLDQLAKIAAAQKAAEAEKAAAAEYERTRNPATKMTMPAMTWSVSGFGSVGIVTVTIDNGNDFPVKDIGIECDFSGSSGTRLSRVNHVIYDTIKAKSKRQFKDVNVGFINSQSARAGCSVETAKRL